jgi:hypothetical protein
MNYGIDLYLFTQLEVTNNILLYSSYTPEVEATQDSRSMEPIITSSVDKSITKSLVIQISMSAAVALLIIPLVLVLRQRVKIHERVFDLIASVDS